MSNDQAENTIPQPSNSNRSLLERRTSALGPAYRLFYEQPVHLVRGEGVWLFDSEGRRYLDCYNNVASVGHCNPVVVQALSKQAKQLNTHTRYLHENIVTYAERLTASMPSELDTCMFVCTGTEANDLAIRIARSVTGQRGAIVVENAYHGNSVAVTELSTSEYPASERPDYLAVVEPPYPYRGSFGYQHDDWGMQYAALIDQAIDQLRDRGHQLALYMACGIFDSNGALVAPPHYFSEVYRRVREAGGLCVADEVQSGLGRLGDNLWGFQDWDVVPDIVTLGKPIGDGHPLAAVVTRRDIAERFAREYGYFNTFGGNPVSAAVGLAVLDVFEQENLLAQIRAVGTNLKAGLEQLASGSQKIGEVRGKGLFFGLEIVADKESREPDSATAEKVKNALRQEGILLGTTGPFNNVIKIRPPLVFQQEHADLLLEALQRHLGGH